jgi:glycosyltransferase involved in cell wall biosynthesis
LGFTFSRTWNTTLKILHIIVCLDVGGAETALKRLIEFEPASIPNTAVVSLTYLGEIGESLHNQGVKVYPLNLSPSGFNILAVMWRLVNFIRQYQPDIVQTWMYHADFLGGLAAYLAGYKNIIWGIRRTSLSSSNPLRTVLTMKICAILSHWIPKKIICVAESAKLTHSIAGYDAMRMVVISNGLDFSQFTATEEQKIALRLACHFSENELIIGCVGRFHTDKGQENFIKAAAIVVQHYPMVKFLLVGRGCNVNNAELMNWLNNENLQERFVLLGERHDVPVCLAAMNIYCMPSRTEGFPNGLAEAMAMGLPCVATDVGDTAVLVGDTAIVVPPEDEQALAQELMKLIALSENQRKQMGQRAKERVMREFSIEKTRARFEAIYREVMSSGQL